MTGATSIVSCFKRQAGMGSRSHDFNAELLSRAVISVTVAGAKRLRPDTDLSLMTGGSAVPVDDLIFFHLVSEKGSEVAY
jgi:hypothetical protein